MNNIYLAKIPDQCSTSVRWVLAKCLSSLDKRHYRAISIIWRTSFHVHAKGICPQPGLISRRLGFFWNLYSRLTRVHKAHAKKRVRLGASLQSNQKICATEKPMPLTAFVRTCRQRAWQFVGRKQALHGYTNNFFSLACNHLPGLRYRGIDSRARSAKQLPPDCVSLTRGSASQLLKS